MKKGLGRELAQFVIFGTLILGVLAILWIATKLGWVLSWFGHNWLPFMIGFASAMAMKLVATVLFDRSKRRNESKEE